VLLRLMLLRWSVGSFIWCIVGVILGCGVICIGMAYIGLQMALRIIVHCIIRYLMDVDVRS
jgi:hypothetical protein